MVRKTFAWLLVAVLAAVAASAQTADELIEKNAQAKGGREKLKAIRTLRMTGKMTAGPGMEMPFTMELQRPNKLRLDFTLQGMTMTQAYDGERGWKIVPFTGKTDPEPMTGEELRRIEDQAEGFDGLLSYRERGHQIEYLGKEDLEGTPAHKLKVTKKNGDVATIYLDAEHFLEVKMVGKAKMQDREVESEATIGDYKEVGGVLFAHSMQMTAKGAPAGAGTMSMTFEKIEVNPDLAPSRFVMPAKAPAPPPQ